MRRGSLVLIGFLGVQAWAAAPVAPVCQKVGTAVDQAAILLAEVMPPPPIPRSGQKTSPHEYEKTGAVTESGESLGELGEGRHIYLIVRTPDGRFKLARSLRLPDSSKSPAEQFFATHRSLMANFPPGTEAIGAGEFLIRNGHVQEFSNGSGTFPGGTAHLQFALAWLRAHGLPVHPNTTIRDYAKGEKHLEHYSGEELASLALHFDESYEPLLYLMKRQMRYLLADIRERFPSKTHPGLIDRGALKRAMSNTTSELALLDRADGLVKYSEYEGVEFAITISLGGGRATFLEKLKGDGEARLDHLELMKRRLDEIRLIVKSLPK